jgi:hypothetical protein
VRTARSLAAAATLLAGIALGACGGSDGSGHANTEAHINVPLSLATCDDWRHADVQQRRGTVRAIRRFAGGPVGSPPGRGAVLDDDQGYRLLEGWCRRPFAGAFRLYRLYTRAAGFIGH